MPLASMTGFARVEGSHGPLAWTWEVKSVNARNIDLRCRLPPGLEQLEALARGALPNRFRRGAFSVTLNLQRSERKSALRIDRDFLDGLIDLHGEYAGRVAAEPPRLDRLLQVRGVVESWEEDEDEAAQAAREKVLAETLDAALESLARVRLEEGERLRPVLTSQLDEIEALVTAAAATAAAGPEGRRARLGEQVAALLEAEPALPEERLAQEAALLATKSDVREELERLKAHIEAGRELMGSAEPVGRRLDFLCQEFNREANTLCAKSWDVELTRIGLDLKAAIDRLREQVQNIE